MQRTQVYFEPEVLDALREEARKRKTTLAGVIREKVEKKMKIKVSKKRAVVKKRMNAAEFLLGIAKLGEKLNVKGPKDLSQRIDEFVYRP